MGRAKDEGPDQYRKLADQLRERKGVQSAGAKLELGSGENTWVEYFRGKDFARYFRAHPEKLTADLVQAIKPGRTVDDQIRDLMHFFVHKGLVIRAERKYKKPKPGHKRLVKFPRTLETSADQTWSEEAFYMWQFERPTSIWTYVGTIALPFVVIAACLFPLAPWWLRMAFVYVLMAVLLVLLSLIAVRYLLFGAVWIVTGHSLWLFPNMMLDQVSVVDAFQPVITYSRPGPGKSQWKQRLVTALLSGLAFYTLYAHSPNMDHLKEEAIKAHDSLFDYLDLYNRNKTYLAGNVTGSGQTGHANSRQQGR